MKQGDTVQLVPTPSLPFTLGCCVAELNVPNIPYRMHSCSPTTAIPLTLPAIHNDSLTPSQQASPFQHQTSLLRHRLPRQLRPWWPWMPRTLSSNSRKTMNSSSVSPHSTSRRSSRNSSNNKSNNTKNISSNTQSTSRNTNHNHRHRCYHPQSKIRLLSCKQRSFRMSSISRSCSTLLLPPRRQEARLPQSLSQQGKHIHPLAKLLLSCVFTFFDSKADIREEGALISKFDTDLFARAVHTGPRNSLFSYVT